MEDSKDQDRRRNRRFSVSLKGRILGSDAGFQECSVVDLSPCGAAVRCSIAPPEDQVMLYIESVGRVEAICASHKDAILRLRFECSENQRQHIAMALGRLLESGRAVLVRPRREERLPTADFHFERANGARVPCDALDISLRGISLRTPVKPPIGELVVVGRVVGRVVRHHENGIGVQFDEAGAVPVIRFPQAYGVRRGSGPTHDRLI
jgi:hypothetical protein